MGKRLQIEPHVEVEELERRYRQASNPIERTRYQIIWLLARGFLTEEVETVTGYYRDRIRKIARRYNQEGPVGLIDRRRVHPGREPMLSDIERSHLVQALSGLAPDGGLWNGSKVADWMAQLMERPVHRQRGWDYLRQMNFRQRIPRPQHTEAETEQQQGWKKN